MIGVAAEPGDRETVEELFELFKTPWEPAVPGRKYRVVLSLNGEIESLDADVFVLYGCGAQPIDRRRGTAVRHLEGPVDLVWGASTLPVYGGVATFGPAHESSVLSYAGQALDAQFHRASSVVRRIGYDLLHEVRWLLTEGQPASRALTPTLELHISVLRQVLLDAGISFAEVLPRPSGHDFICCLTHDVDFFGIRRHRFDRTLAGFVSRASFGTLWDLLRGRRTLTDAGRNLMAVLSLPLVFLGLARDFWRPFADYARVEQDRRSTFFLVPVKGNAGSAPLGRTQAARAVPYQASEIADEAIATATRGNELAVHGIDAWRDADAGRAELHQLTRLTGRETAGVRMHWLYFQGDSPQRLEAAGFAYDSTWGYNESVGYRAGTSQVFRMPGTASLMELPLSIMDSALFFPTRMALSRARALEVCRGIVANAKRFGGTLVINWHERSLAPERLWEGAYRDLLDEVERAGCVWFATGAEAVDWFRWRRSIKFSAAFVASSTRVTVSASCSNGRAALVRVHQPGQSGPETHDIAFDGHAALDVDVSGLIPFANPQDGRATARPVSFV